MSSRLLLPFGNPTWFHILGDWTTLFATLTVLGEYAKEHAVFVRKLQEEEKQKKKVSTFAPEPSTTCKSSDNRCDFKSDSKKDSKNSAENEFEKAEDGSIILFSSKRLCLSPTSIQLLCVASFVRIGWVCSSSPQWSFEPPFAQYGMLTYLILAPTLWVIVTILTDLRILPEKTESDWSMMPISRQSCSKNSPSRRTTNKDSQASGKDLIENPTIMIETNETTDNTLESKSDRTCLTLKKITGNFWIMTVISAILGLIFLHVARLKDEHLHGVISSYIIVVSQIMENVALVPAVVAIGDGIINGKYKRVFQNKNWGENNEGIGLHFLGFIMVGRIFRLLYWVSLIFRKESDWIIYHFIFADLISVYCFGNFATVWVQKSIRHLFCKPKIESN